MQEDLFIEQPEGVISKRNNLGEKLVCKLKKSLYGLMLETEGFYSFQIDGSW